MANIKYDFNNVPFKDIQSIKQWLTAKKISFRKDNYIELQERILSNVQYYMKTEIDKICKLERIPVINIFAHKPLTIKFDETKNKKLGIAGAIGIGVGTILTGGLFGAVAAGALAVGGKALLDDSAFVNQICNYIISCRCKSIDEFNNKFTSSIYYRDIDIKRQRDNKEKEKERLEKERIEKEKLQKEIREKEQRNREEIELNLYLKSNNLTKEQYEIKKFLDDRGISQLYHFTDLSNLESIEKNGLLSRLNLERKNIHYSINDHHRFDNKLDYISLSVSTMNEYLYKAFKNNGTIKTGVLLQIDSSILYKETSDRIYCNINAAAINCSKGTKLDDFKKMFDKTLSYRLSDGTIKNRDRSINKTPYNYTTDIQAEILFHSKIPLKYILLFENLETELTIDNPYYNVEDDCIEYAGLISKDEIFNELASPDGFEVIDECIVTKEKVIISASTEDGNTDEIECEEELDEELESFINSESYEEYAHINAISRQYNSYYDEDEYMERFADATADPFEDEYTKPYDYEGNRHIENYPDDDFEFRYFYCSILDEEDYE